MPLHDEAFEARSPVLGVRTVATALLPTCQHLHVVLPLPATRVEGLEAAFQRLHTNALKMAKRHYRWSSRWSRVYFILGLPAAVLAAVAGATALASTTGRIAAGVLALCSAGIGAAASFLDSEGRRRSSLELAAGWAALTSDVEIVIRVDFVDEQWRDVHGRSVLDELLRREAQLNACRVGDSPGFGT